MGLASARTQAVQGLQAQSDAIGDASKNIANASTAGYKASRINFSTLVTSAGTSTSSGSGGVNAGTQQQIGKQGLIESTGRVTDLAISGGGFFSVQDTGGSLLLTRAGAFDTNNSGELVNANGFTLMGWPLDDSGRRPGETGNTNTTAAESVDSLTIVDTNTASGTASATSAISIGMNLNAGQGVFQGATQTLTLNSSGNGTLAQGDIVAPLGNIMPGDVVTFTSNQIATTFDYGGYARSADLAVTSLFGATAVGTTFQTSTTSPVLAENDKFTISTTSSGTVTYTFTQSSPDTTNGQFNSLESLAIAINSTSGLTARIQGTELFVSSTDATEAITFADIDSSNLHNELGFSDVLSSTTGRRWNTLQGLALLVNTEDHLGATVISPAASASLQVYSADPLETLTVTKTHETAVVDLQSDENGTNDENDIIVPINGGSATMLNGTSTLTLTGTNTDTFTYGGFGASDAATTSNTIFGASSAAAEFTDGTGGLDNTDTMTFTNESGGAVTVTYTAVNPNTASGQFNSLATLAAAIDADANFSARVANDILYVASLDDADDFVRITATSGITDAQIETALGGNFVEDAVNGWVDVVASGTDRFYSISSLAALINTAPSIADMTATVTTGTNASMTISDTATTPAQLTIGGATNTNLLRDLGLAAGDVGDTFFTELGLSGTVAAGAITGTVAVSYDPIDETKNMASGQISPHFSRNVRVFDSLGTGHDFRLAFLKTGVNKWAIEFYSLVASDVVGRDDGQVVNGTVEFNGDGSLKSVTSSLLQAISVSWSTGASASSLTFSLGTAGQPAGTSGATVIGLTDGIRQFDSSYNVEFVEQNGVAAGLFSGIDVSTDGTVNARFSNGEVKAIYQLPVLVVANVNGLTEQTGNVWAASQESGEVNLKVAGIGGAGEFVAGSLESSTSDIASELTRTIGIQASYNANATLISTAKAMEEELNRRI